MLMSRYATWPRLIAAATDRGEHLARAGVHLVAAQARERVAQELVVVEHGKVVLGHVDAGRRLGLGIGRGAVEEIAGERGGRRRSVRVAIDRLIGAQAR